METHPDNAGLMELLSGEGTEAQRIVLTIAVSLLFALALVATGALLR